MDIETGFIRHVLEANPDLILSGKYIVQPPVRHIFTWCHVEQFCWPWPYDMTPCSELLFMPGSRSFYFDPPMKPKGTIDWSNKPNKFFAKARRRFDRDVNFLRNRDFVAYIAGFNLYHHTRFEWTKRAYLHIALGEFEDACAIADAHESSATSYYRTAFEVLKQELRPMLIENNHNAISAALRTYESDTIKQFGIEHLCEQTPFPFELPESERPNITARFELPKKPARRRKFAAVEYTVSPKPAADDPGSAG